PSSSASSIIAASAFANPSKRVDLWITLAGYPQPHTLNSHNKRHERFRKSVTHVPGLFCHPCRRLHRQAAVSVTGETLPRLAALARRSRDAGERLVLSGGAGGARRWLRR